MKKTLKAIILYKILDAIVYLKLIDDRKNVCQLL